MTELISKIAIKILSDEQLTTGLEIISSVIQAVYHLLLFISMIILGLLCSSCTVLFVLY